MPDPAPRLLPDGHATSPRGFRAAGVACGLKPSGRPDLALLVADGPCAAAGVFTRSRVVAAPVTRTRAALAATGGVARAVVANSGCANACTGAEGEAAARAMQRAAAGAVGCAPDEVLVLSTGVIGRPLDVARVEAGIAAAAAELAADGGPHAAVAIMTTDTRPKELAARVTLAGGEVTVGGLAKGAGMIHPDMATMLALLTTDAAVAPEALDTALRRAVDLSFHRISVDGDTSTNDTVLALASGASGVVAADAADLARLTEGLTAVAAELARMIVRDGEGATRFVTIEVRGARDEADAARAARTVATSPLVKTAFAGGDPNWGRILAAAGRAGVALDPGGLSLALGAGETEADGPWLALVVGGLPTGLPEAPAAAVMAGPAFRWRLDLGTGGPGAATVWTCDLTAEYVAINADYTT